MMDRVLIAVDDSAPALAAAMLAIELASTKATELNFVTVIHAETETDPMLHHVLGLAHEAGLRPISTTRDGGQPFEVLLAIADEWRADVIFIGRSDKRRPGQPYVGSQTEHLLEFSDLPVVVVPDIRPVRA